jgi:gas vesicle protein
MDNKENKTTSYVIGGLIGAILGVIAAYLLQRSSELEGEDLKFSGKKMSKTALGVISLLWSLIEKGKG